MREAALCDCLMLWLDCDREGENISSEVVSVCLGSGHRMQILRAHFSSVTARSAALFSQTDTFEDLLVLFRPARLLPARSAMPWRPWGTSNKLTRMQSTLARSVYAPHRPIIDAFPRALPYLDFPVRTLTRPGCLPGDRPAHWCGLHALPDEAPPEPLRWARQQATHQLWSPERHPCPLSTQGLP